MSPKPSISVRRMFRAVVASILDYEFTHGKMPEYTRIYGTKSCVDGVRRKLRKHNFDVKVLHEPEVKS